MFNALRRVISEPDDVGRAYDIPSQQQQQHQQQQQEYQQQQQQGYHQQPQQQSPDHQQQQQHQHRPNLVEIESEDDFMDLESDGNAPVSHIRRSSGCSMDSSLSGASDHNIHVGHNHGYGMEHDLPEADPYANNADMFANINTAQEEQEQQLQEEEDQHSPLKLSSTAATLQLQPMDDESSGSMRASSQNSSRDWGWFEDVHHPSELGPSSSSPLKKEKKKGSGKAAAIDRTYATLVPLSGTVQDVVRHQEQTGTSRPITV
jgi:hypothetical protein